MFVIQTNKNNINVNSQLLIVFSTSFLFTFQLPLLSIKVNHCFFFNFITIINNRALEGGGLRIRNSNFKLEKFEFQIGLAKQIQSNPTLWTPRLGGHLT